MGRCDGKGEGRKERREMDWMRQDEEKVKRMKIEQKSQEEGRKDI